MRLIISLVLVVLANSAIAQSQRAQNRFSEKKGILLLECSFNVKSPYFIESSVADLKSLLETKDSVMAIVLGTPGNHASDLSYIEYLENKIRFDSASILILDKNHLGIAFESTFKIYYAYGTMRFVESNSFKLKRDSKKFLIGEKATIVTVEDYAIIEEFRPGK